MSAKCQTWIQEALKDPEIRNLIPKDVKIECNFCDFKGAFDNSTRRIILCENNLPLRFLFNQVLKHEAVHASDSKYEASFDDPCLFRACTEIRAAKFSNECSLLNEFLRGNWPDFKKCVKRKANLSTRMDPKCYNSVDLMWGKCFETELNSEISD